MQRSSSLKYVPVNTLMCLQFHRGSVELETSLHAFALDFAQVRKNRLLLITCLSLLACVARRFEQSERAEKAAKLRKLVAKPRGACSFVTAIRLLKPPSDAASSTVYTFGILPRNFPNFTFQRHLINMSINLLDFFGNYIMPVTNISQR